ncbi:MAG: DoxX family protein [Thermonemataceae bacterium]|nr:DoxX family protein [Thermonemataceae bacterium]
MNLAIRIITWLVAALFIFSGLVKLNDPVGSEIKFEEYFDVFADDFRDKIVVNGETKSKQDNAMSGFFEALKPFSLSFAIMLSALEVIWGVNLLLRFRPKFTLWALFLLVLFFTGLTFYSWYFNKVTDCGCFGDAIKLEPFQTFMKDIILSVLIGFLLLQNKKITANSHKIAWIGSTLATLFSFGVGLYAINFLPIIDFMPYKVGNHLPTEMKPKKPLKFQNTYIYTNLQSQKDENYTEKEFTELWEKKLSDSTKYKYKDFKQILLNPEDQAKIGADFVWIDGDTTSTKKMFKGIKLLIVVSDVKKVSPKTYQSLSSLLKSLKGTDMEVIGLSSDRNTFDVICHEYQLPMEHHSMDSKILKAMVRSNPGLLLLKDGTVKGKWHYKHLPTLEELKSKN